MVNASSVLTGIRHTVVYVGFAMHAGKTRDTIAHVRGNAVDARGVVLAWTGLTLVDICCAVFSCITGIAEALLLRCSRVV